MPERLRSTRMRGASDGIFSSLHRDAASKRIDAYGVAKLDVRLFEGTTRINKPIGNDRCRSGTCGRIEIATSIGQKLDVGTGECIGGRAGSADIDWKSRRRGRRAGQNDRRD